MFTLVEHNSCDVRKTNHDLRNELKHGKWYVPVQMHVPVISKTISRKSTEVVKGIKKGISKV